MASRVATDGSASPNPGPCGWAWVAEDGTWGGGWLAEGTNNIGELNAILQALVDHPDDDLVIEYDSQYAQRCITEWGPSWRRRGLTEKKNLDLVYAGVDALAAHRGTVEWEWVKGHAKGVHPLNEAADALAATMRRQAAQARKHPTGAQQGTEHGTLGQETTTMVMSTRDNAPSPDLATALRTCHDQWKNELEAVVAEIDALPLGDASHPALDRRRRRLADHLETLELVVERAAGPRQE